MKKTEIVAVSFWVVGLCLAILSLILRDENSKYLGTIGVLIFALPFLTPVFLVPAGLIKSLEPAGSFSRNVIGLVFLYVVLFPSIIMLMISLSDSIFHFLPNFIEAMAQGEDRLVVQTMREQWRHQAWTILAIVYGLTIFAGLIFRLTFSDKVKKIYF